MAKEVRCQDIGFDCGFVAHAESEEQLMQKVAAHAHEVHGVDEVTPEVAAKVKSVMHDV